MKLVQLILQKKNETVRNGRKQSETFFKHFSWTYATKQLLFCRAKVRSPTVSNRFPLDTFGPSKKNCVARKCLFFKEMRVRQVLAWSRFRLFPTVSDRFIFSEGLIGPIPFMEGWSSANPCKPWRIMTLKFFRATLVRVHCTKYCILTLISNIP